MRIINAHAHVLKARYEGLRDGSLEALGKDMKRGGIEKSLVFSSFADKDRYDHDWVELSERLDDDSRFELIYSVDSNHDDQEEEIRMVDNALDEGRLKGVKVPLGYQSIYPNDERLHPFYKLCEKYELPVIFHTGDTWGGNARVKYAHPLNIDDLAGDRPNLKIVMAHVGNPWTIDAAEVICKNPNVYGDLSGLFLDTEEENHFKDHRYKHLMTQKLNDLIAYAGGDKLLFGTDFPLVDSVSYVNFILTLNFTNDEKQKMFHGNAEKLFRL